MQRTRFKIAAVYDTETCNVGRGENTRAYPILFILNDLRRVDLREYVPDCEQESIALYRTAEPFLQDLDTFIAWGRNRGVVPIVCAYNLMFDLQPILYDLRQRYEMEACAQSTTNVYYLDLMEKGKPVLRFYDAFFLETGGLAAMGKTCGFDKAAGDWDYDLTRTPDTPLTDLETGYAKRDVQVVPAYFRYLLEANSWLKDEEIGSRVLTKTSLVRQQARHEVGNLLYMSRRGKPVTLDYAFNRTCMQELPQTFAQYCLRKACFRGGFTFTSANSAHELARNVASLDVTSMHHLFLNGCKTPVHFARMNHVYLQAMAERVVSTPVAHVLGNYDRPFCDAFHARIEFRNIRLRQGSAFERWGIGLCPEGKFKAVPASESFGRKDEREQDAQYMIRGAGWHDSAVKPVFAFSKLMSAEAASIHVSERELWAMAQVYEWDDMRVVLGEGSFNYATPPDYISLMSNILFERKSAAKLCNKKYDEGQENAWEVPESIPEAIADGIRAGTLSSAFLASWYGSTVKGAFNSLYGMEAQDIYKPDFLIREDAELFINADTRPNRENWADMQPKGCKVLYTYGMRIVGGSRLHLVIAIALLHEALGDSVRVLGGDTDSLKVECAPHVTDDMLLEALEPLHAAARRALRKTQARIRRCFPKHASDLAHVGEFEVEDMGGATRAELHMECWNKARVSMTNGHSHVTCAGLSRPAGSYHIETAIDDLVAQGNDFASVVRHVMGYDSHISHDICHALQRHRPMFAERYEDEVTDYLGSTAKVNARQSVALYPVGRMLGETVHRANMENVTYLRSIGREVDTRPKFLELENGAPVMKVHGANGIERVSYGA